MILCIFVSLLHNSVQFWSAAVVEHGEPMLLTKSSSANVQKRHGSCSACYAQKGHITYRFDMCIKGLTSEVVQCKIRQQTLKVPHHELSKCTSSQPRCCESASAHRRVCHLRPETAKCHTSQGPNFPCLRRHLVDSRASDVAWGLFFTQHACYGIGFLHQGLSAINTCTKQRF